MQSRWRRDRPRRPASSQRPWRAPRDPGDRLALIGPLGAGKTQFAKGFAAGLGVSAVVNSPSFTLMAEYPGRLPLFHQDLYRLGGAADAIAGGLFDERQDAGRHPHRVGGPAGERRRSRTPGGPLHGPRGRGATARAGGAGRLPLRPLRRCRRVLGARPGGRPMTGSDAARLAAGDRHRHAAEHRGAR